MHPVYDEDSVIFGRNANRRNPIYHELDKCENYGNQDQFSKGNLAYSLTAHPVHHGSRSYENAFEGVNSVHDYQSAVIPCPSGSQSAGYHRNDEIDPRGFVSSSKVTPRSDHGFNPHSSDHSLYNTASQVSDNHYPQLEPLHSGHPTGREHLENQPYSHSPVPGNHHSKPRPSHSEQYTTKESFESRPHSHSQVSSDHQPHPGPSHSAHPIAKEHNTNSQVINNHHLQPGPSHIGHSTTNEHVKEEQDNPQPKNNTMPPSFDNRYTCLKINKEALNRTKKGFIYFFDVNSHLMLKDAWEKEIIPRKREKSCLTTPNSNVAVDELSDDDIVIIGEVIVKAAPILVDFGKIKDEKPPIGEKLKQKDQEVISPISNSKETSNYSPASKRQRIVVGNSTVDESSETYHSNRIAPLEVSDSGVIQSRKEGVATARSNIHISEDFSKRNPDLTASSYSQSQAEQCNDKTGDGGLVTVDNNMKNRCRRFIKSGSCPKGSSCKYLHSLPRDENIYCKNSLDGMCTLSSSACWFKHKEKRDEETEVRLQRDSCKKNENERTDTHLDGHALESVKRELTDALLDGHELESVTVCPNDSEGRNCRELVERSPKCKGESAIDSIKSKKKGVEKIDKSPEMIIKTELDDGKFRGNQQNIQRDLLNVKCEKIASDCRFQHDVNESADKSPIQSRQNEEGAAGACPSVTNKLDNQYDKGQVLETAYSYPNQNEGAAKRPIGDKAPECKEGGATESSITSREDQKDTDEGKAERSQDILQTVDENSKRRCRRFLKSGSCALGTLCNFLHSKPKDDGIYCTRQSEGKCERSAAECMFKHKVSEEENMNMESENNNEKDSGDNSVQESSLAALLNNLRNGTLKNRTPTNQQSIQRNILNGNCKINASDCRFQHDVNKSAYLSTVQNRLNEEGAAEAFPSVTNKVDNRYDKGQALKTANSYPKQNEGAAKKTVDDKSPECKEGGATESSITSREDYKESNGKKAERSQGILQMVDENSKRRCRRFLKSGSCALGTLCNFLHSFPKDDGICCTRQLEGKCGRSAAECMFKHTVPVSENENMNMESENNNEKDGSGNSVQVASLSGLLNNLKSRQKEIPRNVPLKTQSPTKQNKQRNGKYVIPKKNQSLRHDISHEMPMLKISKPRHVGAPRRKSSNEGEMCVESSDCGKSKKVAYNLKDARIEQRNSEGNNAMLQEPMPVQSAHVTVSSPGIKSNFASSVKHIMAGSSKVNDSESTGNTIEKISRKSPTKLAVSRSIFCNAVPDQVNKEEGPLVIQSETSASMNLVSSCRGSEMSSSVISSTKRDRLQPSENLTPNSKSKNKAKGDVSSPENDQSMKLAKRREKKVSCSVDAEKSEHPSQKAKDISHQGARASLLNDGKGCVGHPGSSSATSVTMQKKVSTVENAKAHKDKMLGKHKTKSKKDTSFSKNDVKIEAVKNKRVNVMPSVSSVSTSDDSFHNIKQKAKKSSSSLVVTNKIASSSSEGGKSSSKSKKSRNDRKDYKSETRRENTKSLSTKDSKNITEEKSEKSRKKDKSEIERNKHNERKEDRTKDMLRKKEIVEKHKSGKEKGSYKVVVDGNGKESLKIKLKKTDKNDKRNMIQSSKKSQKYSRIKIDSSSSEEEEDDFRGKMKEDTTTSFVSSSKVIDGFTGDNACDKPDSDQENLKKKHLLKKSKSSVRKKSKQEKRKTDHCHSESDDTLQSEDFDSRKENRRKRMKSNEEDNDSDTLKIKLNEKENKTSKINTIIRNETKQKRKDDHVSSESMGDQQLFKKRRSDLDEICNERRSDLDEICNERRSDLDDEVCNERRIDWFPQKSSHTPQNIVCFVTNYIKSELTGEETDRELGVVLLKMLDDVDVELDFQEEIDIYILIEVYFRILVTNLHLGSDECENVMKDLKTHWELDPDVRAYVNRLIREFPL